MKDEIKKALEQATAGQWLHEDVVNGGQITTDQSVAGYFNFDHWICQLWFKDETPMQNHKANGHLIANAPTWLRWQNERIEQLEKALNEITELGWSERFGGGYQYMGEYHSEAIKIARQALGKGE